MNITEFAKRLNLSKGTVSRALNDRPEVSAETRQYVLEKAELLGFSRNPNARHLATGRTHLIQLECPYNTQILSDQYLVELARGLETTAGAHGFDLLLHLGNHNKSKADVPAVDGLIIVAGAETTLSDIKSLTAYGHTPAVVISDTYPTELAASTSYVQIDVQSGVRDALKQIAAMGHKRLGYIRSDNPSDNMTDLAAGVGLVLTPELIIQAGVSQQQGYNAALQLLNRPRESRPTVLLSRTDILAAGAVQAAQHLGLRIPADVSIVGHDDIDLAALVSPPLTTISIDLPSVARTAMELLTDMIAERSGPAIRVLTTTLIVRGSLGRVPVLDQR